MKKIITIIIAALILTAAGPAMADITINVSGKSSVFFSGLSSPIPTPAGWTAADYWGDLTDPDVIPPFVDITGFGGTTLSITASGEWGHTPTPNSGPDGYDAYDPTEPQYLQFGISAVDNTRLNTLIGVFLTDDAPNLSLTPASLTFGTSDMTSPLLQQTFVIGSSLSNITSPFGATRLFLGLNNGYEWTNNSGSVDVTVVPVPGTLMVTLAIAGLAAKKIKETTQIVIILFFIILFSFRNSMCLIVLDLHHAGVPINLLSVFAFAMMSI